LDSKGSETTGLKVRQKKKPNGTARVRSGKKSKTGVGFPEKQKSTKEKKLN